MTPSSKILLAGYRGLVGSSILRRLQKSGYTNILTIDRSEIDLCSQHSVDELFAAEKPQYVFLAAAKVGGVLANNTFPADFIRDNLLIQTNVIDAAQRNGVERFLFLGSSCIYPRLAPQPLKEEYLLTGPLEPTNEPYAVAKIAGIILCQSLRRQYNFDHISLMPTNLYGPGDNYDLQNSHVLPALIRKFHEAKISGNSKVVVWGTGKPKREFLYVADLADAAVFLMEKSSAELDSAAPDRLFNVGTGTDITIAELANIVRTIIHPQSEIIFDPSKPDGTPRKLLNIDRISSLGWQPTTPLEQGIPLTYQSFLSQHPSKY